MAKLTNFKNISKDLSDILAEFKIESEHKSNLIVKRAAIKTWGSIIKMTPVADKLGGAARGNWQIDLSLNNRELKKSEGKDGSYVAKELPDNIFNQKVYLFNNLPYINTLEFGGYPKNSKTGNKTVNGYSTQAPRGMVRVSLTRWKSELKKAAAAIR